MIYKNWEFHPSQPLPHNANCASYAAARKITKRRCHHHDRPVCRNCLDLDQLSRHKSWSHLMLLVYVTIYRRGALLSGLEQENQLSPFSQRLKDEKSDKYMFLYGNGQDSELVSSPPPSPLMLMDCRWLGPKLDRATKQQPQVRTYHNYHSFIIWPGLQC